MNFAQYMPALQLNPGDPIFIGDIFGLILALPVSLFLAFWMSAVKNKTVVVVGALIGTFIGFLAILAWAGTLIYIEPLPGANGASVFFGSVLFCSALGISGGIILDLIVARRNVRDYRRQPAHE